MLFSVPLIATGCVERGLTPIDPCTVSGVVRTVRPRVLDQVDLLFVIDDSRSMEEEQENLKAELGKMVRVLASGDTDQDGIVDFPPVSSLRVGLVSTDMGTGGFRVDSCAESRFGRDALLRTDGDTRIAGCAETYPAIQNFNGGSVDMFASDISCVASMGIGGCGFEQQLDAMLKALTPSASSARFAEGTSGHGDNANAGFLRDDALLAIVLLTDEDDCSARDPNIFDTTNSAYDANPNFRCWRNADALHDLDRFVNGLIALKSDPDLVLFAPIVGIPVDLAGSETDYAAIQGDPRMVERINPAVTHEMAPSCVDPERGEAYPPTRIVEVARRLAERGANATVQSLCQDSFAPALNVIIAKIGESLRASCLPRELGRDSSGRVGCDVSETLELGERCEGRPGRVLSRKTEEGAEVCRITQQLSDDPSTPGWYYDETSEACDFRIAFTVGAEPRNSLIRLECLQAVTALEEGEIGAGTFCEDDSDCISAESEGLRCEERSRRCQFACNSDADCPGSTRCVDPEGGEAVYCVNPICGQ